MIAVDVGNTSMHFGTFPASDGFPQATRTLTLSSSDFDELLLARWLPAHGTHCYVASVFRDAQQRLCEWLSTHCPALSVEVIGSEDFPIKSTVDEPHRVGADRLAAAFASEALRDANRPAIIVDSGTAITVDAVDSEGRFVGGAIAPGWRMSAEALYQVADLLPLIEPVEQRPPAIGNNTEGAIHSGLYWGAVGVVRELVHQIRQALGNDCHIFVTGGGAAMLAQHLDGAEVYPDLVLSGIVLAARQMP